MNKKIRWITETAVLLALLVVLQAVTSSTIPKPVQQFVTGSCVNAVLAVSAIFVGLSSGLIIALVSPVLAYLLGIAPQLVTVPAIMVGNAVFTAMLWMFMKGEKTPLATQAAGWVLAAVAKFATLYFLVVKIICGLAAAPLLEQGLLKEPMLKMLPTMFAWPQLITALIGGGVALLVLPVLKKALHR